MATFISTSGRLCWLQRAKPSLSRRASAWQTPSVTSMPAARSAVRAVSGHGGIGIDGGGHNAAQSSSDQRLRTGPGAAGVVAGLQGHIGRAAAQAFSGVLRSHFQRHHLGVIQQARTRASPRPPPARRDPESRSPPRGWASRRRCRAAPVPAPAASSTGLDPLRSYVRVQEDCAGV